MVSFPTKFASALRSSSDEIAISQDLITHEHFFIETLNAFPDIVLVLNQNRQIVYCNKSMMELLGLKSMEDVLGKRPGEAFHCVHSSQEPGGCGTTEFCKECGVVKAILTAQQGGRDVQECRLTVKKGEQEISLDLRVWTVPVVIQNEKFTLFTIRDIASEKKREVLERTFFHDIINEATILSGYSENLKDGILKNDAHSAGKVHALSQRIIAVILAQRDLLWAESGGLEIKKEDFEVYPFLSELVELYRHKPSALCRPILLECPDKHARILTDKVLLSRIMGNLIINALEATAEHQMVKVVFKEQNGQKIFSVHNVEVMSESVRLQIFQRSFSTKGKGRGIGTYSVKLLTEQYLKGKVTFESKEGVGTTFSIIL